MELDIPAARWRKRVGFADRLRHSRRAILLGETAEDLFQSQHCM
jgi:hypothetical protein